jgi:hypothetical protein
MDVEFNTIFAVIGWRNIFPINEPGVKLLTMEFLCTLQILEAGARVSFRMFNRQFTCTGRRLSDLLGFDSDCVLDFNDALPDFQKEQFWKEISDKDNFYRPKNSDLQLPTFHFIHRFISSTLFPRPETQTIREDELKIFFAIVNKRKISPIVAMMHQWLEVFGPIKGDIECTSLVFHIANRLRLTNNYIISHISEPHSIMDLDFFRQAQILKKTNNTIFMRYHGMITEILFPNLGHGIYAVRDYLVSL